MIIIKFHGGLGNQMYQYCFYKYVKENFPNKKVKADLDRYIFKKYIEHNGFELTSIFDNVEIDIATTGEIIRCGGKYERHKKGPLDIVLKIVLNKIYNCKKRGAVYEGSTDIKRLLSKYEGENENLWLCGYWAGKGINIPIHQFVFKNKLDLKNQKVILKNYLKKKRRKK